MLRALNTFKKLGSAFLGSWPVRLQQVVREVHLSRGYNHFYYTKFGLLPADAYTRARSNILLPYFHEHMNSRTVLDLGSANGYFSLLSGLTGARDVLGIERDRKMLKQAAKVSQDMGLNQVRFENQSIYDLDSSYRRDVLIALAIIHWFKHTQRPHFLTFEGIFEYLDNLVGECLFVEYIAPEDPTFIQDPQLTRDMSVDKTEFSRDQFLHCIEKRFSFVKHIGDSRRMRSLYLARR